MSLRISEGSIMIRRPIRTHFSLPALTSCLSVQWDAPISLAASSIFSSGSSATGAELVTSGAIEVVDIRFLRSTSQLREVASIVKDWATERKGTNVDFY
jgi:hypothetical protein